MDWQIEKVTGFIDVIVNSLDDAFSQDISVIDTCEVGAVVDILKDLTESVKDMKKAEYYELVCEAMEKGQTMPSNIARTNI